MTAILEQTIRWAKVHGYPSTRTYPIVIGSVIRKFYVRDIGFVDMEGNLL